jgi:hypothetical protein
MGVTIHYRGTLRDEGAIEDLTCEVSDICRIMKWPFNVINDDWTKPSSGKVTHHHLAPVINGNLGLKGISFQPHPDCEWVHFCFEKTGVMTNPAYRALDLEKGQSPQAPCWNSVKTQFAPLTTHVAIVKLFGHVQSRYVSDMDVSDEGQYWETGDIAVLVDRIAAVNRAMDMVEEELQKIELPSIEGESNEDFICRLEQVIGAAIARRRRRR